MTAPQWFYARGKQRVGPLSTAQLRALAASGSLSPADMVTRTGSQKWVPAGQVKGLFPEAAPVGPAVPPPLPTPAASLLEWGWTASAAPAEPLPVLPGTTAPPPPLPAAPAPSSGADSRARLLGSLVSRQQALAEAHVVPDSGRCVQCGCCSYNCPMGIDVRDHAHRGQPIHDSYCLTCGECVKRCPRGVLSFGRLALFSGG
jgi:NAD-dependent dihydropyrimidine dehydrogenase PreA subunit